MDQVFRFTDSQRGPDKIGARQVAPIMRRATAPRRRHCKRDVFLDPHDFQNRHHPTMLVGQRARSYRLQMREQTLLQVGKESANTTAKMHGERLLVVEF